jgi:hypothetical protein
MIGVMQRFRKRYLRQHPGRAVGLRLAVIVFGASAVLGVPRGGAEELKQSGTLVIEQTQVAFIGSGNLGGGTLNFNGRNYRFTIGGLGVGGFGISKINATGKVYNLTDIGYFPGAYVQFRYGYAVADASGGELWLKNSNGVVLELDAKRVGLAISLGGDAVYINLD